MPTDFDALLDAYMAGEYDDDTDYEAIDPPELADLDDLDRMLFRARLVDADTARLTAAAERRIAEITAWRDDLLAGLAKKRSWIEHSATSFAAAHFATVSDKVRTVKVPNGEIRRRPQQDRVLDVDDATATVIHALDPDLAPTGKPKVAKNAVKERCEPGDALAEKPDEEGYMPHQAVLVKIDVESGEVTRTPVPGLVIMRSKADKISAHPAETEAP